MVIKNSVEKIFEKFFFTINANPSHFSHHILEELVLCNCGYKSVKLSTVLILQILFFLHLQEYSS